jgi:uncharacterized protein (UPF0276 family)
MATMHDWCDVPPLGVGIVYMAGFEPALHVAGTALGFIEVEPQQHWFRRACSSPTFRLDHAAFAQIRALDKPCVVHSVGCPIGGHISLLDEHAEALRDSIAALSPPWVSEHLSFNEFQHRGGRCHAGFLLPPLAVRDAVETAARQLRAFARVAGRPVAIETGVNYLAPQRGEMPDGAFVAAVAEAADCGILLDLHNIWSNARNGRQSVDDFVAMLPLERIVEVHLAGGEELDGYWLDAHSDLTPAPLMDVAARIVPRLPRLKAITFEMMDEALAGGTCTAQDLVQHLHALNALWATRGSTVRRVRAPRFVRTPVPTGGGPDAVAWENAVGALATGREPESSDFAGLVADPGTRVLRRLVEAVRAGTVIDTLRGSARLIALARGRPFLAALLERHWRDCTPLPFATDEAQRFARHVQAQHLDIAGLDDLLEFEAAACRVLADGTAQTVTLGCDPADVLAALDRNELPAPAPLPHPMQFALTPLGAA